MRKYLLHVLIISFVFLLTPACDVAKTVEEIEIEIEDAKEEVRKNPDDASAHNNLGNAYHKSGRYEEAIESYKQAIRIDPDDADAHFYLGLACLGSNDRGSALEQYKILKSLDTELANKLFNAIYE
jgi:tetratricopeptide (TPR) repeat protein